MPDAPARPPAARAARAFAVAGAAAAAVHVGLETDGALREWRQTLPLAAVLGALTGWAARPSGAIRGAVAAVVAMAVFAAVFALGHAAIEAGRGAADPLAEAWASAGRVVATLAGPTGATGIALGALAGLLLRR